jgi:coniferyl-aldehyde dehydrogenase
MDTDPPRPHAPHAITEASALPAQLAAMRAAWERSPPSLAQRRDDLARLRDAIARDHDALDAAIQADFGQRSRHENLLSEAMIVQGAADHARRHLARWSRRRRVGVGWRFWPAQAWTQAQPRGVVGIMSPWNYPVNLALAPLVSALAAGNHVLLKPSELSPNTSAWIANLVAALFPPERVAVALGGAELGAAFAALPLDHLLFTGSTTVGRKVMQAAAASLTPVTLELGGKSPALLLEDAPLPRAAARIASGKWFNAGQTCIGVDHVWVDLARREALVEALTQELRTRYPDLAGNPDYTRIIDARHWQRLMAAIEQARAGGARIVQPLAIDPGLAERERIVPPTLVLDAPPDGLLMREEIFGPVLPILGYATRAEAIARLRAQARPLALYVFGADVRACERIVAELPAGGACINDTLLHFGVHTLPFGGIGASGMGQLHGEAGFLTFSQLRPVFRQRAWAASDRLRPPYRGAVDRLVRLLAR